MKKMALLTILVAAGMLLYFVWKAGAFQGDGKEITAEDVMHEAVEAGERVSEKAASMLDSLGLEPSQ